MDKISVLRNPARNLRSKLFCYMFILAALLILALLMGLVLFGQYESTAKKTFSTLDVQMEVFEKDIHSHFDSLAAAGIQLSEETSYIIDEYLSHSGSKFSNLEDNQTAIVSVQEALIEPLRHTMLLEDCSGVFMLLDTTINSSLENSEKSRAGIWLQENGYEQDYQDVLMYRGLSNIARSHGIMPHRKWHMEFRTDIFPDYEKIQSLAGRNLVEAYCFTEVVLLPGTSEKVMLLALPVTGADGIFYGICGFEISASYFQSFHAQPAKTERLTYIFAPGTEKDIYVPKGLSCGTTSGYHQPPSSALEISGDDNGLVSIHGENDMYVGIVNTISISPNNEDYILSVMIEKSDYRNAAGKNTVHNVILAALLIFFAVTCCLLFSKRFLIPVLRELDSLRNQYESARTEISRLAYSRKKEIDPDNYQQFLAGIPSLTPTERRIFGYYLDGKTVKEVIDIASIKESTLRYHNQNIYSKLGVNSLKQLVLYGTVMRQQEESNKNNQ